MARNNELRELVERRLRGGHVVSRDQCGGPDRELVGPCGEDLVRLAQLESQLTSLAADNQALKTHQKDLECRLEALRQKNTRF